MIGRRGGSWRRSLDERGYYAKYWTYRWWLLSFLDLRQWGGRRTLWLAVAMALPSRWLTGSKRLLFNHVLRSRLANRTRSFFASSARSLDPCSAKMILRGVGPSRLVHPVVRRAHSHNLSSFFFKKKWEVIFPVSRLSVETDQYLIRSIRVSPNPELRLASCKSRNRSMRTTIRRRPAGRLFVQSESKRITIRKGAAARARGAWPSAGPARPGAGHAARSASTLSTSSQVTPTVPPPPPVLTATGDLARTPRTSCCIALHPQPGWSRTARGTPSRRASTGHPRPRPRQSARDRRVRKPDESEGTSDSITKEKERKRLEDMTVSPILSVSRLISYVSLSQSYLFKSLSKSCLFKLVSSTQGTRGKKWK
jgi:hypothetical protein